MATYQLKSMGEAFDSVCRPAGQCTCRPIVLQNNDLYYDPQSTGVIKIYGSTNVHTLKNGDIVINVVTGIKYEYSSTDGFVAVELIWPEQTYIILGEISGIISIPADSTLFFQGGKFTSSLTGNYTTIEAGPTQIFDVNLELGGTFTNECAYPEWWGAKATKTRKQPNPEPILPDCKSAIQAAFDSPFYKIEFATGFYLLSDTIYLNKRKHIKMQGCGVSSLWDRTIYDYALGTVLWTNNTITALVVDLAMETGVFKQNNSTLSNPSHHDQHASLIWEGGCIDVSYYGKNHLNDTDPQSLEPITLLDDAAILYCPRAEQETKIHLALRGPMPFFSSETIPTTADLVRYGIGIHITNSSDHTEEQNGMTVSDFDVDIFGFSTGVMVDYERYIGGVYQGALTSLSIHGVINRCFRYIYAPSGGFAGGVIDCTIQTKYQNLHSSISPYLIEGKFDYCYLNPFIWDYSFDRALKMTSWKNVRMGPRMLTILSNLDYEMMMTPKDVAGILYEGDGLMNASVGAYDLRQLGAVNGTIKGRNYIHTIDNDLLSYDKMWGQEDSATRKISVVTEGLNDVSILNKSPFDNEGFKMNFNPTVTDMTNASLTVTIPMPTPDEYENTQVRLALLIVHLKGQKFTYFNRMTVCATHHFSGSTTTLYDGSYAELHNGYNDVVLPLIFQSPFNASELSFQFEGLAHVAIAWQDNGSVPNTVRFKFAVEGRFNIHPHNNIWSASGGDMGKHILRLGKPYLLGTKKYATFSDLPANASLGAMGLVNETYPVVKTSGGWMVQELVGSTTVLASLSTTIGNLSTGQQAFNTTVSKPVWWDGTSWVDAAGNII